MNLQAAIVVNEAQFLESVHEETNARAGGADHPGQGLLTDFRHHGLRNALLAEVGEQ